MFQQPVSVLFDAERLRSPYSGLGQVCQHLGRALLGPKGISPTFLVPKNQAHLLGENAHYQILNPFDKLFGIASKKPFDVWHATHQDSRLYPRFGKPKRVFTIHDLNFLERPDYSSYRKKQALATIQKRIDHSDAITSISHYTASVVKEHLSVGHIQVIHNGVPDLTSLPQHRPSWLPENIVFGMSVGIVQPKKNFKVLLPILDAHPTLHWVIAGNNSAPYATEIKAEAQLRGVANRLWLPGMISDTEKAFLLANAGVVGVPSLAEGFGLPVIEALQFGTPVMASSLTSLPEVGGKFAVYLPDFQEDTVVDAFDRAILLGKDPTFAPTAKAWAGAFSWEHSAQQYAALYTRLAANVTQA